MKDTELIRAKTLVLLQLLIPLITWSVVNVTADINDFRFFFSRPYPGLTGGGVSAKL